MGFRSAGLSAATFTYTTYLSALSWAARRIDLRDDRGEITSTTIAIAFLAALAIAVGAIITLKVTQKAESIPTQ